jgi:hypothetical protein
VHNSIPRFNQHFHQVAASDEVRRSAAACRCCPGLCRTRGTGCSAQGCASDAGRFAVCSGCGRVQARHRCQTCQMSSRACVAAAMGQRRRTRRQITGFSPCFRMRAARLRSQLLRARRVLRLGRRLRQRFIPSHASGEQERGSRQQIRAVCHAQTAFRHAG